MADMRIPGETAAGKSIVIVGAGIGGLSAGIRLLKAGYSVTILEKESRAGGRMNVVEGGGYRFDSGPTIGLMPSEYKSLFDDAGVRMEDYLEMDLVKPFYSLFYPGGKRVKPDESLLNLVEYLESLPGNQVSSYLSYLSGTYRKFHIASRFFLYRNFNSIRDILRPSLLRALWKLHTFHSAHREIGKYTDNPEIRSMLSFQTLYIGVTPRQGPSIYSIIPMIQNLYGVWFPKGGMAAVAEALVRLFRDLGGELHTDTEVTGTRFEGKRIRAVETAAGVFPGDKVLFNSDFNWTLEHLIPRKLRGKYTSRRLKKMKSSCSALLFYFGVKRKLDELDMHNLFFARDFDENLKQIFSGEEMEDFSYYLYLRSRGDSSAAPEYGESLYALIPVADTSCATWSQELVDRYRQRLLDRIALSPAGDIRDDIEFEEVWSPLTLESKFNAWKGSAFGLAPTLTQSLFFRPQARFRSCEGVYFTGCSTHPGAGVPIVMISGRLAAEEIARD